MNWFHRLLNPHCPDCKEELRENKINPVEEALKLENARMQEMIDRLFDRLLEKPETVVQGEPAKTTRPAYVPWRVRQQMLEREDREKARAMREVPKPDAVIADAEVTKKEQEEFEAEVANAERAREASSSSKS